MKPFCLFLLTAWLLVPSAHALRIWFSATGVGENEPINGTPSEYVTPDTGVNPAIDAQAGAGRLYVWATLAQNELGVFYRGIGLDITFYPRRGTVQLIDSRFYNYQSVFGPRRWEFVEQGQRSAHKLDDMELFTGPFGYGLDHSSAVVLQDLQYDANTFSMLLGFLDLTMTPDARADVLFAVGGQGFVRQPPTEEQIIYFGWGDEPLRTSDRGRESRLPDATIVPEPASAFLLLAAGALGLRRR